MVYFQDLPHEVILKVISYLGIKDLIRCGQASKRIREISCDESLWRKLNFTKLSAEQGSQNYYKHVLPTKLLKMVLENGCQYLCLEEALLGRPLERSYVKFIYSEHALKFE